MSPTTPSGWREERCECFKLEEAAREALCKLLRDGKIGGFGKVSAECVYCVEKRLETMNQENAR